MWRSAKERSAIFAQTNVIKATADAVISCLSENFFNISSRVARWHIFKTKILIWVNFGGSCNGRYWYILHVAIRYILRPFGLLWPFGIFYGYLVYL
jgi:hypothetical protein